MTAPPADRLTRVLQAQRAAAAADPLPPAALRRDRLRRLKRQIGRYQDVLAAAMDQDFGGRAAMESKILDLMAPVLQINHLIRHLGRWMRPRRRPVELLFLTNRLHVTYQPKGVVGVIVPWNFPVYLALGPLAAALAAGNRVMIKMAEDSPRTAAVLAQMLAEVFAEDEVAVFHLPRAEAPAFAALPFDHLVFTGSPAAGRQVMAAAAQNLVPVTLELGGKSPALVGRGFPVAEAALRIVHGKGANSGQICVAPDHAFVPREAVEAFAAAAGQAWTRLFGRDGATRLASGRQAARLWALIEDARARGARILPCGPVDPADPRQMPLHLVLDPTPDMAVMQEEIFGPILPVLPYDSLDEALARIAAGPSPLALYWFGTDAAECARVLRHSRSGGVTVNDWGWHVVNHAAPFGGIGNSGMGNYHGIEGFRELSHARTVFRKHRFFPVGLIYPPYGGRLQKRLLRLILGRPDRGLTPPPPDGKTPP